jgi:hypothetical protein
MNDETRFIAAVLKELATSTAVILAAWGALGGATSLVRTCRSRQRGGRTAPFSFGKRGTPI